MSSNNVEIMSAEDYHKYRKENFVTTNRQELEGCLVEEGCTDSDKIVIVSDTAKVMTSNEFFDYANKNSSEFSTENVSGVTLKTSKIDSNDVIIIKD